MAPMEIQEMQIDPKCSNLRMIQPHLSVGESSSVDVPNSIRDLRKELKLKSPPLPPRHHKWNPPEKSRITLTLDQAIEHELKHGRRIDPNKDMKTLRRTISNRLSAQRSRMKRLEHINELENRLKYLEVVTSGLRPKVEIYKEKKRMLEEEKVYLKTAVETRTTESINNEYKIEERRREIDSLKQGLNKQSSNQINENPVLPKPKPYSLEFYQQRLTQIEMTDQFLIPSSEQDSKIELSVDQVQVEVDQYLNFDGVV